MANGSHSASYVPQVNSGSGEVFDWRAAWRQLVEHSEAFKEEARALLLSSADNAAAEASALYPPAFKQVVVREISRFRVRVSVANRHVNFFDFRQSKGRRRKTQAGRNRGQVTPARVMGAVARKHRAALVTALEQLVEHHRDREVA